MDDAIRLREEVFNLKKQISILNSDKEKITKIIDGLHKEKIQYLKDIPEYKKQADDARSKMSSPLAALHNVLSELSIAQKEYDLLRTKISDANKEFNRVNDEIKIINSNKKSDEEKHINNVVKIKSMMEDLRKIEESCINHKKSNDSHDALLKDREAAIFKRENDIASKELELERKIEAHKSDVDSHGVKVDALIEHKQLIKEEELSLKNRIENVNKLEKEISSMKYSLVKQEEKLNVEIKNAQSKQASLDKAINDLKNEEKRIKILELKVIKMAKEANLDKELKDLMGSLK